MLRSIPQTAFLVFFSVLVAWTSGFAQERSASSVNPTLEKNEEFSYLPAVKTSTAKKKSNKFRLFSSNRSNKKYKGSLSWQMDQQVLEFEQRMKAVAKQRKKEARMDRKPQYSDPLYFGHKRKPKKRKPGKRKLCKECLVVH